MLKPRDLRTLTKEWEPKEKAGKSRPEPSEELLKS